MTAISTTRLAIQARIPALLLLLLCVDHMLFAPSVVCGQEVMRSGYVASEADQRTSLPPLQPIDDRTRDQAERASESPPGVILQRKAGSSGAASPQGVPVKPPRQYESIPLRQPDQKPTGADKGFEFKTPDGVVRNTAISLGLVLGLFLVVAWMMKKSQPRSHTALPSGVVEVLGRVQTAPKQQLQLIRMGPKLLLVSSTGQQMQTLGEISEPHQVEQIVAMCQSDRSGGISQSFRQIMGQYEKENVQGFLGETNGAGEGAAGARNPNAAPGRRRRAWT
jgi:flagellar biogenesis protein FliO